MYLPPGKAAFPFFHSLFHVQWKVVIFNVIYLFQVFKQLKGRYSKLHLRISASEVNTATVPAPKKYCESYQGACYLLSFGRCMRRLGPECSDRVCLLDESDIIAGTRLLTPSTIM